MRGHSIQRRGWVRITVISIAYIHHQSKFSFHHFSFIIVTIYIDSHFKSVNECNMYSIM